MHDTFHTSAMLHQRLEERLKGAGVPFVGTNINDHVVRVDFTAQATSEQIAAGEAIASAFSIALEVQRDSRLKQNDQQYETLIAAGYTPPGKSFAMKAGTDDQTEYMKLDSSVTKLVGAGIWTNETSLTILDSNGLPQNVTVAEWAAIAVGYTVFCLQSWQDFATRRLYIQGASSLEELAAIP